MTVLNRKNRDAVETLLNDHASVTHAISCLPKAGYQCGLDVSNESGNDFIAIGIDKAVARKILNERKAATEAKLKKLGITVG